MNGSFSSSSNGDRPNRHSRIMSLDKDQVEELAEAFQTIDVNGDGEICFSELQNALKIVGIDLPGYEVRQLITKYSTPGNTNALSFEEFGKLYGDLKQKHDIGHKFRKEVKQATGVIEIEGQSETSQESDIKHTIRIEEQVAFSDWINSNLREDPDLKKHLPIDSNGETLYEKVADGMVLCKLINLAVADTIDERVINKGKLNTFTIRENQTLALLSAQAIGCNIVNIDGDDLAKAKKHLVLGLLWQIIRIGLFSKIDLKQVPGLAHLLRPGETLADLQKLSPEEILMRWVNYHLEKAGVDRRVSNFTGDIKDSVVYTHLMHQIAPKELNVTKDPLFVPDGLNRADSMLNEADKLGCKSFVKASDVVNGVYKLNIAFVANLFNTWPGLNPPDEDQVIEEGDVIEESREEKTYRNWMNSMGVNPTVNWLYSDLCNGIVIFQLYDIIKPGIVDWKRVVVKFKKLSGMMDQIQNCNYAVDLGKQLRFSLVGIQGKDIYDGIRTLTLGLVWQLMRAYTLSILAQCSNSGTMATDKEIVQWVNQKLQSAGKESCIRSFQDSTMSNSVVVCDLIDAIQPGAINYDLLKHSKSHEDNLANAKYAITVARKIGAKIYALPEDIVEIKPKMVMTVFACLMARDYLPSMTHDSQQVTSPLRDQHYILED